MEPVHDRRDRDRPPPAHHGVRRRRRPGLGTGGLFAELLEEGEGRSGPSWFESWPDHEQQAARLCYFEPCLVPGLLQTEEYARAVVSAGGLYRSDRVEELVNLRMSRQRLLHRENLPECVFVIDESALHRPVGGPVVINRQLGRLL
jgi:hypothetical protein